jgi:hypothetical protein
MHNTPPFRNYLASILLLILIGWGGLTALFIYTLPTVWPRWAFFLLWVMALTGTAMPFTYFYNRRFPSDPPAEAHVIVRQALWVGVYGATLAWLQLGRLVTLWVVISLAGGLFAMEYFIRLRELAGRKTPAPESNSSITDPDDTTS